MDEPAGENPKPRRRLRRWLKRLGLVFLVLLGLLAVFHRPIIFEGTRYFIVRAAKQQNLDLAYDIGGSIFSTLTVSNLKAAPTEPGPVQRIEIGNINLRYSLWGALRHGLPALLDLVEVKDVRVEITPAEQPPPARQEEPQQFKFPALFPKTLQIENVNFIAHAKTGDTVVEGLWFTLLPDQPGVLKVRTLDIPGVRKWTDISGRTTFRDRDLVLTDFHIGPEIALQRLNLDASRLGDSELGLGLEGRVFGAPVSLDAQVRDLNASNDLTAHLALDGLEFQHVWDYLNLSAPLTGRLDTAKIDFSGKPEEPKSWTGTAAVKLSGLKSDTQSIGAVALDATLGEGKANAAMTADLGSKNAMTVNANADLPAKLDEFPDTRADGNLSVNLPDLAALTGSQAEGAAAGRADFKLDGGIFTANADIQSPSLAAADAKLSGISLKLSARKNLRTGPDTPPFAGAIADVDLAVKGAKFQDYEVDALAVSGHLDGASVLLRELSMRRGSNSARIGGEYRLPADMKSFAGQPWKAEVAVTAPKLDEFVAEGAGADLRGTLSVTGGAQSEGGKITGDFTVAGRTIAINGLNVPAIDGKIAITNEAAKVENFSVTFNDDNSIYASGGVELKEPFRYQGTVEVNLTDLSLFDPLSPQALAGSLTANWSGSGDAKAHSGEGAIHLVNGQFDGQAGLNAEVQARYTPEMIDVPVLRAQAEMGGIAAKVHWEHNELAITDLVAQLKELPVLSGALTLPLDLSHLDDVNRLVPDDGAVNVALEIPKLQLPAIFRQLGQDEAPVSGSVSGKIAANGTIANLAAELALNANHLEVAGAEDVQPADVALNLSLRDKRLAVDGKITEPRIHPLVISGGIPLDVAEIKRVQKFPPDTPLDLSVKMDDSPLGFVAGLVPAIRFIDGTADIDIAVSGTASRPKFSGTLGANIPHLRLNTAGLPPLSNIVVRIDSTTDRLTVSQFRGETGGGVFGAEGTVNFSNPGKPVFDLAFGSRDALVMQDESITLRLSSRIRVAGPLDAATVSGDVYVTHSRFYKDIDILPIGLPGRPAPQPPEAPPPPGVSQPPLRDWKFDIAVRTADPFLVQGNLANGRIDIDLRVGGTGMEPWMDGSVRIRQLRTSLPFSTLEIDNGLVYFTKDHPFLPQFDIRGTSQIRDYSVTAYIYGGLDDPQANFTSNPPLPQTEIVSLIATGVTSEELAGNPSVLAGKAAMLLFQKIYRSIFKRNSSEPPKNDLLSRIDIDLGATDPKTGQQSATVRFPLSDNVVLVGGLDVGGNFRGQVKYLIRFR